MISSVRTCLLHGLDAHLIDVQADVSPGRPGFNLVGLADAGVKEARERVRSALRHSGLPFPQQRLTVNLAPAELRKEGSGFDLPIAVAIVLAQRGVAAPAATAFIGELALDGGTSHVNGVLVAVRALRRAGIRTVFVPSTDIAEASLVDGIDVLPAPDLASVMAHLTGVVPIAPALRSAELAGSSTQAAPVEADLAEVVGQEAARRALELAAAGGHHLLLTGPPGAGKTMLARCLPGILPLLTLDEAIEVAQVRSVLGELEGAPLVWQRPFRAPHHSISTAGLLGGGTGIARPGEISRADHGVLFLDELAEFQNPALQGLRQPLEQREVTITRSRGAITYPARFMLVAATNPCPCGWAGDDRHECRCSPAQIDRYQRSLSGPLLDRIDLRVAVTRAPLAALSGPASGEASASVRDRVLAARGRQSQRQGRLNAQLDAAGLRHFAPLGRTRGLLARWADERGLTARGFHRAWRVARTAADLDGADDVAEQHVLEALGYRLPENERAA